MVRIKKVNRYYCEFCGKGGCSAGHANYHESHCTLNPLRNCGFCLSQKRDIKDIIARMEVPQKENIEYQGFDTPFIVNEISDANKKKVIDWIMGQVNCCPACTFAVIRQSGLVEEITHVDFDFKAERIKFWDEKRTRESNNVE